MNSSSRRTFGIAASTLLFAVLILLTACGDVYRPVATPIIPPGGDPQNTHYAIVLNTGDLAADPTTQGNLSQFDVSGDTNMGNRPLGINPVAASIAPGLGRAWAINQGTPGHDDSTAVSFQPFATGIASSIVNLEPNAGANAVDTTASFAFVTEGNLNKVAIISAAQLAVRAFVPVGNNPVAVAARPDGQKAYVANKNDATVTVVSTQDNAVVGAPISVGATPVALAMQTNGAFLYAISQGAGSLSVIDTSTDAEVQRLTGLSSPKQVVWDDKLKRVYVVNDGANTISVFNASTPGSLTLQRTVTTSAVPVGIAVLDSGAKFYVLYGGTPGTVDVFDAQSFGVRTTVTVQNNPVSIAAAPESTKVYVVNNTGDAGAATPVFPNGSISIIKTLDESVLNVAPGMASPTFVTIR